MHFEFSFYINVDGGTHKKELSKVTLNEETREKKRYFGMDFTLVGLLSPPSMKHTHFPISNVWFYHVTVQTRMKIKTETLYIVLFGNHVLFFAMIRT